MKRYMNVAMVMVVGVMCAAFLVSCAGSYGSWDEQWFSEHPLTQEEVIAHWGAPEKVISHDDGVQELVYRRVIPPGGEKAQFVYTVKDGKVIKQCWKH
jgi:hypothetical protein